MKTSAMHLGVSTDSFLRILRSFGCNLQILEIFGLLYVKGECFAPTVADAHAKAEVLEVDPS